MKSKFTHATIYGDGICMPAVRALRRAVAPIHAEWDDACAADHGLCPDGYGAEFVARRYGELMEQATARVAARFGYTARELERQDNEAFWLEEEVLYKKGLL